jgi:hypothetical protein
VIGEMCLAQARLDALPQPGVGGTIVEVFEWEVTWCCHPIC